MSPLLVALLVAAAPAPAAPVGPPTAQPPTLSLIEAERRALERHPDLRAANADLQGAQARARQARAPLLPQVDLGASTSVALRSGAEATGGGRRTSTSATLSGSLLLWDFGQTRRRSSAAQRQADASEQDLGGATLDLLLDVRLAFIDVLQAQELLTVAQQTLANDEQHMLAIEEFVRLGARPSIDRARLRSQVANAQATLVQTTGDLERARLRLAQTLGQEGDATPWQLTGELPPTLAESSPAPALVDQALRQRPELAALRLNLEAQSLDLEAAQAGYLPALRARADAGYGETEPMDATWSGSLGLSLSWMLFDGWATAATVDSAHAAQAATRARLASRLLALRQEVAAARVQVETSVALLAAAGQSAESATELLRLAEERYTAGAGDSLELTDAQLEQAKAQAARVRAAYDLAASRANLLRVIGQKDWN